MAAGDCELQWRKEGVPCPWASEDQGMSWQAGLPPNPQRREQNDVDSPLHYLPERRSPNLLDLGGVGGRLKGSLGSGSSWIWGPH